MTEQKIYKPRTITGFPEWLPEIRRIEQQWMDHIRKVFESYGFCSIETPSVEELDVLRAKGEVDKEIYVIERLHKDENEKSDARLALHFDQTVPLARYVAQHFNELDFPFKRYQMQRVWRGERPQSGRFREFYQCDIDVIGVDNVPIHFDGELASIMVDILRGLNIGPFQMQVSNRKILIGYFEGINITDPNLKKMILTGIDKSEKDHGEFLFFAMNEYVLKNKDSSHIISHIKEFLELAKRKYTNSDDLNEAFKKLKYNSNTTIEAGLNELSTVLDSLAHLSEFICADLSIVRGLDYYTGTVYETKLLDNPSFGSICSGGRYDDLAGSYINKHLPGVGLSIGLSRLFDYMRINNKLGDISRKCPTDVLVCVPSSEKMGDANIVAKILRGRGMNVELYHSAQKIKKQIEYASKRGIPYIWFPPFEDGQPHEVKNMQTGEQKPASPEEWIKS
jgi:histidyl-tRNA synthetase